MNARFPTPGLRGRLLLSTVAAVALMLAVLTAAFNIVLDNRLNRDVNSLLRGRVAAELSAVRARGGRIAVPEAPDDQAVDTQVWIFDNKRALERPRADPRTERAAAALAGGPRRFADVPATDTRLYAVPVERAGVRLGTVVAGASLVPYEESRRTALIASMLVAALALLAVSVAAWWLVSRALRPVARMTVQAAEWSDRDLDRRFSLGEPHDELTQLAATLDALLDRLATSLRHEQRFSAELSHELRTPLASVIAEAQLALRHAHDTDEYRASLEQVLSSAEQMNRTLDTLMAAARAELDPRRTTSDANACARAAADAYETMASERGIELAVAGAPTRVAVKGDLVERILAPLVENACRYGRSAVWISTRTVGSEVLCTVEDDGDGVPPTERETIFEPGRRGSRAGGTTVTAGAGLGLALSRRLARAAGGDVELDKDAPGARFVVRLPRA